MSAHPVPSRPRGRLARLLRLAVAGAVLALFALVIPGSSVQSTEFELVKLRRASGVDLSPDVLWILAVGSDARLGENMLRSRGDALQLIGMNTKTGAATAIGIARDSWVSIPGVGYNRINAALYYGGPRLLGETVGNLVGIQPDYVFVTRFPYLQAMVSEIGGIEVNNPIAFSDTYIKPAGFPAGRIHLSGIDAVKFSRIRHNLIGGDFDRSANQQRVLRGIQAKIRAQAGSPGFIERGVLTVMAHLHTGLPPSELFRIAQAIAQVNPAKFTGCVVTGGFADINGASVVIPDVARARRYGDEARRDATIDKC